MNQLLSNLGSAWKNAHVRWTIVGAVALKIVPILLPHTADQCRQVTEVLLTYGVIAAANSGPAGGQAAGKQPENPS